MALNLRPYNFLFEKYGSVVRVENPLGGDVVMLSNPVHIQEVYNQDRSSLIESTLDSLQIYNKHKPFYRIPMLVQPILLIILLKPILWRTVRLEPQSGKYRHFLVIINFCSKFLQHIKIKVWNFCFYEIDGNLCENFLYWRIDVKY